MAYTETSDISIDLPKIFIESFMKFNGDFLYQSIGTLIETQTR